MSPRTSNWILAWVICMVLAASCNLDGPSETEAAQDVAADVLDAQHSARDVARFTVKTILMEQQP